MRKPVTYPALHNFPGRLSTMPRPASGTKLATEMASLRARGTDILVSALHDPESRAAGQAYLDRRRARSSPVGGDGA
jgi:hypothetical protein